MLESRALAYEFGGLITQLVLCAFRRGGLSEAGHHQEAHPPLSGGGGGLVTKSCLTLLQPHAPCQASLSMEFSKQGYWSGLPFSTLGDLLDPGIEPMSHVSCIGRWVLYHYHHLESYRNEQLGRSSFMVRCGHIHFKEAERILW